MNWIVVITYAFAIITSAAVAMVIEEATPKIQDRSVRQFIRHLCNLHIFLQAIDIELKGGLASIELSVALIEKLERTRPEPVMQSTDHLNTKRTYMHLVVGLLQTQHGLRVHKDPYVCQIRTDATVKSGLPEPRRRIPSKPRLGAFVVKLADLFAIHLENAGDENIRA